jgi:hypothetical protein
MALESLSTAMQRSANGLRSTPALTAILGAAVLSTSWVLYDFHAWKDFGTGGTPPTWAGYWRMTKLRVNAIMHPDDLTDPSPLSEAGPKFLKSPLPQREGQRPKNMPRIMPQRQRPEGIDEKAREKLQSLIHVLGEEHAELLVVKPSKTEGGTTEAIYAKPDLHTLNPIAKNKLLDHEIAHAHPADNSLHVWVSDVDAREIISKGWGQRFPLKFVESGWTMVYAPRTEEEVAVVESIVKAGVAWITGQEI